MKYLIVAVRDRAADVFAQPMFVATKGSAIRSFADEINSKNDNSMLAKHPEDFDLYFLGSYTDTEGSFEVNRPEMIAVGKDLVR